MIASALPFSFRQKLLFIRAHVRSLAPLPLTCGVLSACLWSWAILTSQRGQSEIRERALLSASAQARTYAEQLERSIGQLDYIMLSLQFHWQKTRGALHLEEQVQAGLVPAGAQISITIFDQAGIAVTSTIPKIEKTVSIAKRDYFKAHATDTSSRLMVSKPVHSILIDRDVILLSRRLDEPDGNFAGVMVIAIEPDYLASFVDDTQVGKDDFISILRSDGAFFVAKTLDGIHIRSPHLRSPIDFAEKDGVRMIPGQRYIDGTTRIVAWRSAKSYPLVVVVGLSEGVRLADYESRRRELLLIAGFGSLAFFLIALIGIRHSARRIWQMQHANEVHRAYRLATENAREGFYMLRALHGTDATINDFLIEDCNERGAMYQGVPRDKLIGQRLSAILPIRAKNRMLAACLTAMTVGFYEDELHLLRSRTGSPQWLQRKLIRSDAGLAVTLRDITELKMHQNQLIQLANTDPLTSLPNRHWLKSYLPSALASARNGGKQIGIMFVDLDDFKDINDTLGHLCGDDLLRMVALRLKATIQPPNKVVRLGGDEFTILIEDADTQSEVATIAQQTISSLSSPFLIGGENHSIHASIGISMYPGDGIEEEELLKKADIAMYAAKSNGKGTFRFFELFLEERLLTRLSKQTELKKAIQNGELVLYYQPRVNGETGEVTSMEALVRWIHPDRGIVPPDEFIPLAEETGLILSLGTKVIDMACEQLAQWKQQALRVVPISVNVSAQQIEAGGVSTVLDEALRRHGLDNALLEVEITESATVKEGNASRAELASIQAMGIRLYIDDFGTGYSCLAQLKRLDMDGLKIDRAFTSQLLNGEDDAALFEAIVVMAHALRMNVVAEGVETAEQLAALRALSCDEVQGYFISRPVPADSASDLLAKRFLLSGSLSNDEQYLAKNV